MPDSQFLSAFTASNPDQPYYPPYINFTKVGDKVKVHIRSDFDMALNPASGKFEWAAPGKEANMEIDVEEFKKLLTEALGKLHDD